MKEDLLVRLKNMSKPGSWDIETIWDAIEEIERLNKLVESYQEQFD